MTRIELAPEVLEDFDRILDYHTQNKTTDGEACITDIFQAIEVLAHNPLIGRLVENDKRELVIGRKTKGYLALYQYLEKIDTVLVLAIRSQREAGYAR
jgi:toxin ParE1/3/4